MAGLYALTFPLSVFVIFFTFPDSNLGLLSDYKICGGSGCESPMSRVQAIVDHRGKDCRFLNFQKGEIITVYHKLTGKRDDLWAGSINQNFGYFPKEAVKEDHIYTSEEKIFETQTSDFICMDELVYPVDSSHWDIENDHRETDQQTTTQMDVTKTENQSEESVAVENQLQEVIEELDKQGGLKSSSWLSPSRWLGFTKEEEPEDKETNGNIVEIQAHESTSSPVESEEHKMGATELLTSTVSDWIGFGRNDGQKHEDFTKNNDDIKEERSKTAYKGRKINLELDDNHLQEEKNEMGTFAWLGNGLSSKLGLGDSNPGLTDFVNENKETKDSTSEQRPSSWFGLGIEDMLPFRKDETAETESAQEEAKPGAADTSGSGESLTEAVSQLGNNQDMTNREDNIAQFVTAAGDKPHNVATEKIYNSEKLNHGVSLAGSTDDEVKLEAIADSEGSEETKQMNPRNIDHSNGAISPSDSSVTENKATNVLSDDVVTLAQSHNEASQKLQMTPQETDNKEENVQETDNSFGSGTTLIKTEEKHKEKPFQVEETGVTDEQEKAVQDKGFKLKEEERNVELGHDESEILSKEESEEEREEKPELNGDEQDKMNVLEERHSQEGLKDDHEELEIQEEGDKVDSGIVNDTKLEIMQTQVGSNLTEINYNRIEHDEDLKKEDQEGAMKASQKEVKDDVELGQAQTEMIKTDKENENIEMKHENSLVVIQGQDVGGFSREEEKEISTDTRIQDNREEDKKLVNQDCKGQQEQIDEREEQIEMLNEEKQESDIDLEGCITEEEKQEEIKNGKGPQEEAEDDQIEQREKAEPVGTGGDEPEMKEEKKQELPSVPEETQEEGLEGKLDTALENQELEEEEQLVNQQTEPDEREPDEVENADYWLVKEDNILDTVENGETEMLMKEEESKIKVHEKNVKDSKMKIEELQITEESKKEVEEKEMQQEEQNITVGVNITVENDEEQEARYFRDEIEPGETDVKEVSGQGHTIVKELVTQVDTAEQETHVEWEEEEVVREKQFIVEKLVEEFKETPEQKDTNKSDTEVQDTEAGQAMKDEDEENQVEGNKNRYEGKIENNQEVQLEKDTPQDEARNDPKRVSPNDIEQSVYDESNENEIGDDVNVLGETVTNVADSNLGQVSHLSDEDDSGTLGALGLFKHAISYFGGSSDTEISKPPEPDLTLETDSGPKTELESEQDSTTSYTHLSPTPSNPSNPPPEIERANKAIFTQYRSLLAHMSVDEMKVLIELFGQTKLQFLDFIMGQSENVIDENDKTIMSDIETLLQYHEESLVAPNKVDNRETATHVIALQKLQILLDRVRDMFSTRTPDIKREDHQVSCVGDNCQSNSKTKTPSNKDKSKMENDERAEEHIGQNEEAEKQKENMKSTGSDSFSQAMEEFTKKILDMIVHISGDTSAHVDVVEQFFLKVVLALPDDIRPGPDLYGVPWEPVIATSLLGFLTMLLFTCRCYSSVKSRMNRSKEQWMASQVAQMLDEKCKVLETFSKYQEEYNELEDLLRGNGMLAQTQKSKHLQVKAKQLEKAKTEMDGNLAQLKEQLDQQREHRLEQERRIAVLEMSLKTFEEENKEIQSLEEQAQTTLKVYDMNSDRKQRTLESAAEENTLLQESNAQLRQQVEGWAERVSELEEQMRRCEVIYSGMVQDVANKDERITALTDRLLRMKVWDSDLECDEEKETSNGTADRGEEQGEIQIQKVQKLIYAAKLNADLKSVDEDKDRVFAKLNDEVKAKEDLEVSIEEMEKEKLSMQTDSEHYSEQVQKLQQKLQIMTEMYQENELKLHRLLTVEEKERLQKEEKLNKADKNIALAIEEVKNYRHRAEEMEEELEKTKQSYQTQISAHEKKAHNNWLASRAAERELTDIRRENALIRQKLTDTQFKLDALDKDPYALDTLARPLPYRGERSPFGPSPLGRPASETRTFLSPPTLMEAPPPRLSPRMPGVPPEPQVQGEREGSGPHSDSSSISPTWERDRRGPPPGPLGPMGPPGYLLPEPGGPVYRRPLPPPGVMGPLPPPGPHPLGLPPPHLRGPPGPPHPADMAVRPDGSFRENSFGPGDLNHREIGLPDRRTPPDADMRPGGFPPPRPPMGPMDGPFPRRGPYGPPPPDFYPPRGPGGAPMMPMWTPPHPGMMMPPRFPPDGPPPPHMPPYGPPVRHLPPEGLPPPSVGPPPPQASLPPQPHSQSPDEHMPSPQDVI
ncbi:melanoma inhibitory activity protein 2 [Synchiropus splendidus]|uniref:melanoma inhibitory activity protein 2 n=1 Tax=Synchiropus splendidus TaxID=270530 RepID=UPI00237D8A8B|nr:melanoma inhibitory activity protein 2 [Synchiropus splendidus]